MNWNFRIKWISNMFKLISIMFEYRTKSNFGLLADQTSFSSSVLSGNFSTKSNLFSTK